MSEDLTPEEARQALADIGQRQRASAEQLEWPLWFELALGGCVSLLIGSHAAPRPFDLILIVLACAGIFGLVRHYTTRNVWVSGYRKGRTLPLTIGFVVALVGLYFGSFAGYQLTGLWWIPVAAAVVIFPVFIAFNRVWLAIWRAEMREDA